MMKLDATALFHISYGLYVLTAHDGRRDCGCISNSVMQLTVDPLRIAVSVNKQNHTASAIMNSGIFNISVLTEAATMDVFHRFGFQSGRDVDKFANSSEPVSENGLRYLPDVSNALISGKVEQTIDCGTHWLFIAEVTQAENLSGAPSMTYDYYFANVKPKPQKQPTQKHGWRCRICNYEYEGDVLPPDFVCPICKHGPEDFEQF